MYVYMYIRTHKRTALFTGLLKIHTKGSNHRILLHYYLSVHLSIYRCRYLSVSTYIDHYLSMYNIATIGMVY